MCFAVLCDHTTGDSEITTRIWAGFESGKLIVWRILTSSTESQTPPTSCIGVGGVGGSDGSGGGTVGPRPHVEQWFAISVLAGPGALSWALSAVLFVCLTIGLHTSLEFDLCFGSVGRGGVRRSEGWPDVLDPSGRCLAARSYGTVTLLTHRIRGGTWRREGGSARHCHSRRSQSPGHRPMESKVRHATPSLDIDSCS